MFAPHYHPAQKKPSSSSSTEKDVLEIHTPIFDLQTDEAPQETTLKGCHYWHGVKLVAGPNVTFAQCSVYHSPERTKPISSAQEHSATTSLSYIPYGPSYMPLCGWPPQQDPAGSSDTSFGTTTQASHFGKKALSEEMRRFRQVKWWQCQRSFTIPYGPYS